MSCEWSDIKMHGCYENRVVFNADYYHSYVERVLCED